MLQRHLLLLVLERVEWLELPLHEPVLRHELDKLGRPVGSSGAHRVSLLVGVANRDTSLLEHLAIVVRLHALVKLVVGLVARVFEVDDALVDSLVQVGEQPQVISRSLGDASWDEGLELVGHALDDVLAGPDALVLHDKSCILGPAARAEDDEDGCNRQGGSAEYSSRTSHLPRHFEICYVVSFVLG